MISLEKGKKLLSKWSKQLENDEYVSLRAAAAADNYELDIIDYSEEEETYQDVYENALAGWLRIPHGPGAYYIREDSKKEFCAQFDFDDSIDPNEFIDDVTVAYMINDCYAAWLKERGEPDSVVETARKEKIKWRLDYAH